MCEHNVGVRHVHSVGMRSVEGETLWMYNVRHPLATSKRLEITDLNLSRLTQDFSLPVADVSSS